ncbi:MAG: diguanylate cyclase [Nitrospirae bacterium]|nr:MAG: diguanylate cyclase [Nitrospirota bacterium]
MKVCFPVQRNEGIESTVYNHFGSAPFFVVVDTASNTVSPVTNADQQHAHGACSPIKALGSQQIDAVIVGGIGGGALSKLGQMGVKVYKAGSGTIADNLDLFLAGRLPEYSAQSCCGGHGNGSSCAH